MKALLLIALAVLASCAWIESDAGKARYRVEPFETRSGQVVCCAVDILNAKNIGALKAVVTKGADGSYSVDLTEEGVDAVGPMGAMVEQNGKLLDAILKMGPLQ